ncbi:MAG: hypothetical protein DRR16_18390 [Candidatus Parabeggiatoa sp. nov. 3]|nr:MAG: hypothetical protein DRR00_22910 [Gammaproteobacteria bacterium]RKZ61688.1 MAG: hypothetical protein DRQ99_20065 [Gammaproteobacteria bacterium]RKZ82992.1 MAG: hypothetical protein DRR16_18390 [Gammaproteobacteria bacterium]HEW98683.1 hypothetical protein [Beggiatoa sp.]
MTTLVKQRLIDEIQNRTNTIDLVQFFELWQQIKKFSPLNQSPILSFAGCLNDEEAEEMRQLIQSEFQHIEGDW